MAGPVTPCPDCGTKNRLPQSGRGRARCASCHADLPWLVPADDATFASAVDSPLPVLVDVWAPWCGPCRAVAPILEELARDRRGRLKVVKVNSDEAPSVSRQHDVRSIPTLLLYRDGREVARTVGALPRPELERWLDEALG